MPIMNNDLPQLPDGVLLVNQRIRLMIGRIPGGLEVDQDVNASFLWTVAGISEESGDLKIGV